MLPTRRLLAPLLAVLGAALATVLLLVPGVRGAGPATRIDSVAGGSAGFTGDGGPATAAQLTTPSGIAALGGGAYLIADTANNRIRRVDANGTITTVAGAGPCCGAAGSRAGDGLAATDPSVRLNAPRGVAVLPGGGFLIADTGNNVIREVDASGTITTVAGTGAAGSGGDGDAPTGASLTAPEGVTVLADGSYLIADTGNDEIRRVDGGIIRTVVGNALAGAGFAGDGGDAGGARLDAPGAVVALAGGGYLIADTGNNRIRRVDGTTNVISTVAGSAAPAGFAGDGGPATSAALDAPAGVAVRDDGSLAIADTGNSRIRTVATDGTIATLAGTGTAGAAGDGGAPGAAQLAAPRGVDADGTVLRIADSGNDRVRAITDAPPNTTTTTPGTSTTTTATLPATVPARAPPGVSPPVLGRRAVATPTTGRVFVRLPGHRGFTLLRAAANIPLGAEVDTANGAVTLFFVTTRAGRRASVIASEGRFVVRQPAKLDGGQRPGVLVLAGPLAGCATTAARPARGAARTAHAAAAKKAKPKPRGRRVRTHAKGRIKTQGRYGAAIVRGTRWLTVDRCPNDPRPGTFFSTQEGVVAVTDFTRHRTIRLPAGKRYLAPAPAKRARPR